MLHLGQEKNCDLEAAKNLWASYTDQERRDLVLAYKRESTPGTTSQTRAVSSDPEPTLEHNPPNQGMASASSPQQSVETGVDPTKKLQNPQPTFISTLASQQSSAPSVEPTQQQKPQPTRQLWRQNSLGELQIGDQPTPVRIRLVRRQPAAATTPEERSTTSAAAQQQTAEEKHIDVEKWRAKVAKEKNQDELKRVEQRRPVRPPLPSTATAPDAGLLREDGTTAESERGASVGAQVGGFRMKREGPRGSRNPERAPLIYHRYEKTK